MTTYVRRNGKLVEKHLAEPLHASAWGPQVISDEMAATRNMADGNYYTSKKKFRDTTRAHGCIEVGNETATMLKPRTPVPLSRDQRRQTIKNSIDQLRAGHVRRD